MHNPMPIEIVFEDADIIVVNKPAGVIVHPAPGHEHGAMTEFLVNHCPQMRTVGSVERPGVVHRLDIETSGVMVFAKTQKAYLNLRREFEQHKNIEKTYLAVVHGSPKQKSGTIDSLIGRDHLRAISHWHTLAKHNGVALVEFKIETGRMHQIRIHSSEIGCPIVGDALYGDKIKDRRLRIRPKRHLLHAVELAFPHPITNRKVVFSAAPPADIIYV